MSTIADFFRSFFLHISSLSSFLIFFFFNDTATTEIYTLSLHDALPILRRASSRCGRWRLPPSPARSPSSPRASRMRSEEHTSELQSHLNLVCRLLLEKKKKIYRENEEKVEGVVVSVVVSASC